MRIVRGLAASILTGVGPRVEEAGLGLVGGYPYSAPYEELRLEGK
jgi:peptide/nickel transport system substrate-binding protein